MGEAVRRFVRETLHCTCPESVFERVDSRRNVTLADIVLARRIDVGSRLLVYILESDDPRYIARHLPTVFARGREERDRDGFNRLRVVVAAGDPERVAAAARDAYERAKDGDEHVHLHLVSTMATGQL